MPADAAATRVADALLFEGYLLYPYRTGALKNRRRWTFGTLLPERYCLAHEAGERHQIALGCVVLHEPEARLRMRIRFLDLEARADENVDAHARDELLLDTRLDALERTAWQGALELGARRGRAALTLERLAAGTARLSARFANVTALEPAADGSWPARDAVALHGFVATQLLLELDAGRFVAPRDPPPALQAAVDACESDGVWPVLIGDRRLQNQLLGTPIIVDDYPEIAEKSPLDLFDATEIDELLLLRVLTLGDAEKAELRGQGARERALLERAEALTPAELFALHGERSRAPLAARVLGRMGSGLERAAPAPAIADRQVSGRRPSAGLPDGGFAPGDRVRLAPRRGADAIDLLLAGKTAVVTSVLSDVDGRSFVCVVLDDDPGRDLGLAGKPGHRFFFDVEEVVAL